MVTCEECHLDLHIQCYAACSPCPSGWIKKKKLGNLGEPPTVPPTVAEPVIPTSKSAMRETAAALFNTFQDGYTQYVAAMDNLTKGDAQF